MRHALQQQLSDDMRFGSSLSDMRFGSNSAACASAATQRQALRQQLSDMLALRQQLSDMRFGSNSEACASAATQRHACASAATSATCLIAVKSLGSGLGVFGSSRCCWCCFAVASVVFSFNDFKLGSDRVGDA
jgi:hypothetical protein